MHQVDKVQICVSKYMIRELSLIGDQTLIIHIDGAYQKILRLFTLSMKRGLNRGGSLVTKMYTAGWQ